MLSWRVRREKFRWWTLLSLTQFSRVRTEGGGELRSSGVVIEDWSDRLLRRETDVWRGFSDSFSQLANW